MLHRHLILTTALAACIVGGACVTASNNKRIEREYRTAYDQISSFLISRDQKTLIVIGQEHHYFLSLTPQIKAILQHPARPSMEASFSQLQLNQDHSVVGQYRLNIPNNAWAQLPQEQQASLTQMGFMPLTGGQQMYSLTGNLSGKRYSAIGFKLPAQMSTFNQPYSVQLRYTYVPLSKTADKILTTPLAVTADGLMIVGLAAGAIIVAPFVGLAELLD